MQATVAATHAQAAQTASTAWIRSPCWDVYWLFSGLWAPLIALGVYAALFGVPTQAPAFHTQHFVLLFTSLGVLHRLSSIHAVMLSPILRQEVRGNPRRYVLVPLADRRRSAYESGMAMRRAVRVAVYAPAVAVGVYFPGGHRVKLALAPLLAHDSRPRRVVTGGAAAAFASAAALGLGVRLAAACLSLRSAARVSAPRRRLAYLSHRSSSPSINLYISITLTSVDAIARRHLGDTR